MKINKKHIAFLLLFVYLITFAVIGFPHAVEIDISVVLDTTTKTLQGSQYYFLMLDEDTPLTPRYLIENPDYQIIISADKSKFSLVACMESKEVSLRDITTSRLTFGYYYNNFGATVIDNQVNQYGDEYLDAPLKITSTSNPIVYTINSNLEYIPPDPPPVEEPEEESTGVLLDGLLDGIKDFFTNLFQPIIDIIDSIKELQETETSIWEVLQTLYEKVKGYTLEPVLEFFQSIIGNDAVLILIQIWDFPIVKELILAAVAFLVIMGFFRLLNTL